jgi:hypothetical protein
MTYGSSTLSLFASKHFTVLTQHRGAYPLISVRSHVLEEQRRKEEVGYRFPKVRHWT